MKLEVLMSCMHQSDGQLILSSGISGDVLMINQCDLENTTSFPTDHGAARILSTTQRGLCRSRNMAIENSVGDVCLLCDDDEIMAEDYETLILSAYEALPEADIIIFNMLNQPQKLGSRRRQLHFPDTMHVSSWQISFRRERILQAGVRFDPLLGAGSGNGAEEELKFLTDCGKAGLKIWYSPEKIASVAQSQSTWFSGYDEDFFEKRGATTRYILGAPTAFLYGVYYVIRKRSLYREKISSVNAMRAIFRGIRGNKIARQSEEIKL